VHNPEYDSWIAKDQQLLGYLLNSLIKEALAPVATTITSVEAWKALEEMFSAHSKAWVANLRMKLATLKKGSMSSSIYFNKMCSIRDELATAGKIINDNGMIQYILTGLGFEYNYFVTLVLGWIGSISLSGIYSQLLSYDMRLEMYREGGYSISPQLMQLHKNTTEEKVEAKSVVAAAAKTMATTPTPTSTGPEAPRQRVPSARSVKGGWS